MNHYTRLDFAVGSAGLMRQAVAQAAHHVANRRAFQRALIDQPIMTNVVADLALEAEGAAWLSFRFVSALDREEDSETERLLGRIGAPIAKYWVCKRAPAVVVETLECHGGNGFIEDHLMARLYREAPLNGIWEGTGNVICLDVLRSMQREPNCVPALLDELRLARGADRRYDTALTAVEAELAGLSRQEGQGPPPGRTTGPDHKRQPLAAIRPRRRGGCIHSDPCRGRLRRAFWRSSGVCRQRTTRTARRACLRRFADGNCVRFGSNATRPYRPASARWRRQT